MSKSSDALELAEAEFVKAKTGKDRAAYAQAKVRLRKARVAHRAEREQAAGTTVAPATLNAKAGVKTL